MNPLLPPQVQALLTAIGPNYTLALLVVGALYSLISACAALALGLSKIPKLTWLASVSGALGRAALDVQWVMTQMQRLAALLGWGTSAKRDGSSRGFVRMSVLGGLSLAMPILGLVFTFSVACLSGTNVTPVIQPAADLLGCIAHEAVVVKGQTIGFLQYVTACVNACGASLEDVLQAILQSTDPAVVPYQNEARAALADPRELALIKQYAAAVKGGSR